MKTRIYAFLTGFVIFTLTAVALRTLTSALGNSAANSMAVGFSILLGLVLGVFYFSSRFERTADGPRVLGLVQLASAICLLVLITVLPATHRAFAFLHSLGPSSPGALIAVRWLLILAVLIVPGFLLGGSIAFIALVGRAASGVRTSEATGAVFLGMAVSVPLVTLVLMPGWGVSMALALAAIVSAAMSAAGLLTRGGGPRSAERGSPGSSGGPGYGLVSAGVFLISYSVISHTVLQMRVLEQVTGVNAYTFVANAMIIALGIFIGCSLLSRVIYAGKIGHYYTGIIAVAAALYLLASSAVVDSLPVRFLEWTNSGNTAAGGFTSAYFYLAALTLLLPAVLLGAALGGTAAPGGAESASRGGSAGLKRVLVPAGAGALLAYALALPVVAGALGLESGLIFVAWLCLAGGIALIGGSAIERKVRVAGIAPGIVIAVVLTVTHSPWNRSALTSGVYESPYMYANVEDVAGAIGESDIVYYAEDLEGIVTVVRTRDGTFLRLNGKTVGSASEKIGSDILAAHIPMLLHGNPENILLLGLGTGVTLGSIQRYDVTSVTAAEPVEAIIRSAPLFSPYTYNAMEDRRTTIRRMGPREFMRLTGEKYDVVIKPAGACSDPVHASTLTTDFMLLARSVLAYDGVFCYVLDLSDLSRECVMTTVSTFMTSFPYVTAWYAGSARVLLAGSMKSFEISEQGIAARLERPWVPNDLKRLQINDATGVLANLMTNREPLRSYLGAFSRPNTDRRPCLACNAVPVIPPGDIIATLSDINEFSINPIKVLTDYEVDSSEYKLARDRFDRCKEARNYYIGSYLALGSGDQPEAARRIEYGVNLCPANGLMKERLSYLYLYISRDLAAAGRFDEAINVARRAIEVSPVSYLAFYNLAALERTRDPETAIALLERLLQINPGFLPADIVRAELLLETRNVGDASEVISGVLSREPLNRRAHHIRALCFVERGLTEAARVELEYVLEANPDDVEALAALGYTWLLVGDIGEAEKHYARAFELEPGNLGVLNNYATILAEKGEYRKAILIWQEGLKLDPTNAGIKANIQEAIQKPKED